MCIRDRAYANARDILIVGDIPIFVAMDSADAWTSPDQFFLCLLYTSDAADERSSVDLGGRRIIKKKNMKKIGGRYVTHKRNKYSRWIKNITRTEAQRI